MTYKMFIAAALAALVATGPAGAQTDTAQTGEAPAGDTAEGNLSMGSPISDEPQVGEPYLGEAFGDWNLRCVKTETGEDPCQLYQLLQDQNGNNVAEISIFPLPEGQQAVAGATIITPLETLLTQQLTVSVDGAQGKRYPFTFCAQVGCIARIGFLAEEVDTFRRGNAATVRIVPAAAPDQEVNLTVSLTGFTAGYNAVRDQRGN